MDYLRLLFWLKWKLLLRGYSRNVSSVIGTTLAIVFLFPFAIVIAIAVGAGFVSLQPPWNEHLLRGVLLGMYAVWLLATLFGFALSESYDITKLFLYPLSPRQIFTGAILGSLLDFPVLFLLPTLVAVIVGFTHNGLSFVFIFVPAALFLFHTLSLSQTIVLASAGALRSRRFRDVAVVLVPLLSVLAYIGPRWLTRYAGNVDWKDFLQGRVWDTINYLPPGLAARAIAAAGGGDYLPAAGFLLALASVSAATIYSAGWLVERVCAGEVISAPVKKRAAADRMPWRAARPGRPEPAQTATWARRLPPVVHAVMDKEIKYIFREPYFKVLLLNLVYITALGAFAFLQPGSRQGLRVFGSGLLWGLCGFVLLSEESALFNIFGTDAHAASTLFLFPGSRREILMGKNLALYLAMSVVNFVFLFVLSLFTSGLSQFPGVFAALEIALVVFTSVGNILSIWFPMKVVVRGWRMRPQRAGQGCSMVPWYLMGTGIAMGLLVPPYDPPGRRVRGRALPPFAPDRHSALDGSGSRDHHRPFHRRLTRRQERLAAIATGPHVTGFTSPPPRPASTRCHEFSLKVK